MSNLDELVLSGAFSSGQYRSSSPARSNDSGASSPEPKWPGQQYEKDDASTSDNAEASPASAVESIGMGPGRTGVKGVIRDRAEAAAMERQKRLSEVRNLNRQLEKTSLAAGGRTWEEDENDRRIREGLEPLPQSIKSVQAKKYGHLREVGAGNYVEAVEDPSAKVIVHIYDPYVERCHDLDATLTKLAKNSPHTKFIRVKATAIGFALKKSSETGALGSSSRIRSQRRGDQERYTISQDSEIQDNEDNASDEEEQEVDTDMLPTILVYEHGELLHTWVRVDWEAGQDGIENLLFKHNLITRRSQPGAQGIAALSDDDEDEDN